MPNEFIQLVVAPWDSDIWAKLCGQGGRVMPSEDYRSATASLEEVLRNTTKPLKIVKPRGKAEMEGDRVLIDTVTAWVIVRDVVKLIEGVKLTEAQVDVIIQQLNECLGGHHEGNASAKRK